MKSNHSYRSHKLTVLQTSLLLAATVFASPTFANDISQIQGFKSSGSAKSGYLLAQVPASCRQVIARGGLRVREQPSISSKVVGTIQNNRNVTIQTDVATNGWVPISTPLPGYVYAQYLGMCDTAAAAAPPPSNCRRIVASAGARVRQQPSENAASVGVVKNNRRVIIDNLGFDGWVPITVPMRGYVQGSYLGYCR
jgi:uncharacterized protein YgiM (DUF1202 family)